MTNSETAVRRYLRALKDPSTLRDDDAISDTEERLSSEEDPIERLKLQQQLAELQAPSLETVEDEFVVHGKAWADGVGITGKAFAAEGVPTATLRRAGFAVGGGGRRRSSAPSGSRRRSGTRVTTEEVIAAIPSGAFTVKMLHEASGASAAVVRKAIASEVEAGRLAEVGPDPDHSGPGRAATLYRKAT